MNGRWIALGLPAILPDPADPSQTAPFMNFHVENFHRKHDGTFEGSFTYCKDHCGASFSQDLQLKCIPGGYSTFGDPSIWFGFPMHFAAADNGRYGILKVGLTPIPNFYGLEKDLDLTSGLPDHPGNLLEWVKLSQCTKV